MSDSRFSAHFRTYRFTNHNSERVPIPKVWRIFIGPSGGHVSELPSSPYAIGSSLQKVQFCHRIKRQQIPVKFHDKNASWTFRHTYSTMFVTNTKTLKSLNYLFEINNFCRRLMYSILPASVANELRHNRPVPPRRFDPVTILFSGIVGFR